VACSYDSKTKVLPDTVVAAAVARGCRSAPLVAGSGGASTGPRRTSRQAGPGACGDEADGSM